MIVKTTLSQCWLGPDAALDNAAQRAAAILSTAPDGTEIFFRADDIAAPGGNCQRMFETFRAHSTPLHLAVTPSWITASRWAVLSQWAAGDDLWIWHQHGWRHMNHQLTGKKGEFGTDRSKEEKKSDIAKGRKRLEALLGDQFQPVFTPPWNRFDTETAEVLLELGYRSVSRSDGEMKKVPLPDRLPDIPINVDLHTRNEPTPVTSLAALENELRQAISTGRAGIMLHHQRMNDQAFRFLDTLLSASKELKHIRL